MSKKVALGGKCAQFPNTNAESVGTSKMYKCSLKT